VYPKTNTWTCFSSNCSAGSGDQVDFIMKLEETSKHEAIMKAKELAGYVDAVRQPVKSSSKKPTLSPERLTALHRL